tara:strand:- start:163 stop:732 length:570 start_codon:yes stop_codon:yes gene_type:complete
MKNLYFYFSAFALSLFISCSSGGNETPIVLGCTDDCALNFDEDASDDDGTCIFSFLGTYTFSEYKANGTSLFNINAWENPLYAGAISFGVSNDGSIGVYSAAYIYQDGTELVTNGTYENSLTQLIFYPSDGSDAQLFNTTKINCLEFDGNAMVDGMFVEIELTYFGNSTRNLDKKETDSKFNLSEFKRK